MGNKDLMLNAVNEMFISRDPQAVDRYVAPDYLQHSPLAADGRDALRHLVATLPGDFSYRMMHALADGDLVMLYGVLYGLGPQPSVAFDLFRIEDGRLTEHWDALAPLEPSNGEGPSSPRVLADVTHSEMTEHSRRIVTEFAHCALVGQERDRIRRLVDLLRYKEHGARLPHTHSDAGSAGEHGLEQHGLRYRRVHHVLAEGEFAFTMIEADRDGSPYACYDLFRVGDAGINEHWGVHAPVPAEPLNRNGVF